MNWKTMAGMAVVCCGLLAKAAYAGPPETTGVPVRTILKFNPPQICAGELNIGLEQRFLRNMSAEVSVGYIISDYLERYPIDAFAQDYNLSPDIGNRYKRGRGWSAGAGVRYYVSRCKGRGAQGLYVGVQLLAKQVYYPDEKDISNVFSEYTNVNKIVGGGQALIGFQSVFGRFVLDPYAGVGWRNKQFGGNYGYGNSDRLFYLGGYSTPTFHLGCKVGMSFQ